MKGLNIFISLLTCNRCDAEISMFLWEHFEEHVYILQQQWMALEEQAFIYHRVWEPLECLVQKSLGNPEQVVAFIQSDWQYTIARTKSSRAQWWSFVSCWVQTSSLLVTVSHCWDCCAQLLLWTQQERSYPQRDSWCFYSYLMYGMSQIWHTCIRRLVGNLRTVNLITDNKTCPKNEVLLMCDVLI